MMLGEVSATWHQSSVALRGSRHEVALLRYATGMLRQSNRPHTPVIDALVLIGIARRIR